jgi:hypothetical protein
MACHIGPFTSTLPHIQETWATKVARAGDRVASLRSNATNFSNPVRYPNPLQLNPVFPASVAAVDCGGQHEFRGPLLPASPVFPRFATALMGQANSETAYIPASSSWRSNCGFTATQVARMAAVNVAVSNVNLSPVFFESSPVSFTASGLVANQYGNNEYAETVAQSGAGFGAEWDTIHVQVRVTGFEDVVDPLATPLASVVVNARFVVAVNLFASFNGSRVFRGGQIGFPYAASATVTLNETEASAFFDGTPLSLAGGAIVVTAVGT